MKIITKFSLILILASGLVACNEETSSSGTGGSSVDSSSASADATKGQNFETDTTIDGVNITGSGSTTQIDENTVEGQWNGSFTSETVCGDGTLALNLRQSGERVSGNISANSAGCGSASEAFTGSLSGNTLTIIDDDGDRYILSLNGDMLSGQVNDDELGTININLFR